MTQNQINWQENQRKQRADDEQRRHNLVSEAETARYQKAKNASDETAADARMVKAVGDLGTGVSREIREWWDELGLSGEELLAALGGLGNSIL